MLSSTLIIEDRLCGTAALFIRISGQPNSITVAIAVTNSATRKLFNISVSYNKDISTSFLSCFIC